MLEHMLIEKFLECMCGILRRKQFLCKKLDFRHICFLKKFLFLHWLLNRLDNAVFKQCFVSYSQSVKFVSMCYDIDVMIDICTEQDIRHKIFEYLWQIFCSYSTFSVKFLHICWHKFLQLCFTVVTFKIVLEI